MIKPISNISNMNIKPIKVPNQNTVSFGALPKFKRAPKIFQNGKLAGFIKETVIPFAKKVGQKIADFFKKTPEYLKKAKDYIVNFAENAVRSKTKRFKNAADITKNAGAKSRTIRNTAVAGGATGGIIGALGDE